jgi:predicted nucleic acid binding AN1-type Zn finger protein
MTTSPLTIVNKEIDKHKRKYFDKVGNTMERCFTCHKKINILNFTCKFCESKFCSLHQLPESHECKLRETEYYETYRSNSIKEKYTPLTKMERIMK